MKCAFCKDQGILYLKEREIRFLYFQGKQSEYQYENFVFLCMCPFGENFGDWIDAKETKGDQIINKRIRAKPSYPVFHIGLLKIYEVQIIKEPNGSEYPYIT